MSLLRVGARRSLSLIVAVAMVGALVAVVPALATPGVPPDITNVISSDQDIDPGETRFYKVAVIGYDVGGTWAFSGTGLTVDSVAVKGDAVRLSITASLTAEGGLRSLTATNPDGLFDTLPDAITVTGDNPPEESGDIAGHVFDDLDGNGVLDIGEPGLAGVSVTVTDSASTVHSVSTDANGDYSVLDLPVGTTTADYATPAGTTLTTGNDSQVLIITDGATTTAFDVGYQAIPSGDITGHVFNDTDGDGIEDAGETGLSGVSVTVTDSTATVHNVTTDASGDWSVLGLPLGNADVSVATPSGFTLTTGNDSQSATITDGGSATTAPVGYEPPAGTPPDITGVIGSNDIDPGTTRTFRFAVTDFDAAGTVTFSGTGLTATLTGVRTDSIRVSVTATSTAEGGLRDVIVTNPDGLSDTLVDGVLVNGDIPPPETGDVTGHVFADTDGDGIENNGEVGLAGVSVSFLDAGGNTLPASTDANGDFTITAEVGSGTLTVVQPANHTLTTGNDSQVLVVTDGGTTAAAPVGYEPGVVVQETFTDVAAAVGINFTHSEGGQCAPPIGVGSAWADVDNDGDLDLYVTNRDGANHLYMNNGGTFTDEAVTLGVDHTGIDSSATVFVDYDNDGDADLFVANSVGNTLWENQFVGSGVLSFVDVTTTANIADSGRVETATWGDVDGDGFLDLYIAKHMTCVGDNTDRLFHNNGDGTFTDWTTYLCAGGDPATCDDVNGLGFVAGMLDYDGDGDTDIYLVNDNIAGSWQPNKMFRNDGSDGGSGWVFTEVGSATNTDLSINGMGLGVGDYNNDGWLDLAFSDAAPGHLLMNNGDGTYSDASISSGVNAETAGAVGWGTAFLDYDNDGWQDLFFAHGTIGSVAPLANALLQNQGDNTFLNVSAATNMDDEARGRNVSLADYDADGWVDVYIGNYDVAPLLMHNDSATLGSTNGYLTVTVEGTESNRDGIGTVITATTSTGTQTQLISSGFNHGGGSQKAAFFGLGSDTSADVSITWPNGVVENLGSVSANQAIHRVEPATPVQEAFTDVASAVGISFTHSEGSQCAPAIGVGSAWADVDNDGDLDLYVTNRDGGNHLYINSGGTFTDQAGALGIDHAGVDSSATVFADYDNDGDADLFVANSGGNTLWENQFVGSGVLSFVDVTATANISDLGRVQTATWGDVDGDGFLDLYIAKHMTCVGDNTDRLFHNNGDGTFTDWTTYLCAGGDPATCDDVNGLGFAAGMLDYDGDGDTDIYLVNDNITNSWEPNKMFRNDGSDGGSGWVFTEVGAASGTDHSVNGMGLGVGDYNNDGWLDLAFTDAAPGHLLMNNGDGTFSDVSNSSQVNAETAGATGWGAAFLDYDNDGWQDLFFAHGSIGSVGPVANALLRNLGDGTFSNVSAATNMDDEARGRNISLADYNGDGWVDVYIGNYDVAPLLMRNDSALLGSTNNYLTITVEGTESNRDGIGTLISVTTSGGTQTQMISSGFSHGGGSQKAAFFGLGADATATVTITWPNGVVENLGSISGNQAIHEVEPAS